MIRKLDHVGIAVSNLDAQTAFYRDVLGLQFLGFEDLPERGLRIGVFDLNGVKFELLCPTDPDSAVGKFIASKGEGIHHIAFCVDDIDSTLDALSASGVSLIDAKPRPGAGGSQVAFLHPKSTFRVLMELCAPGDEQHSG